MHRAWRPRHDCRRLNAFNQIYPRVALVALFNEVAADDSIITKTGSGAGCIADEFQRAGVHFEPARKADPMSGWQRLRRLLADCGKPDRPGLYVSRACRYWWLTAPYAGRDMKRPEDVDSSGADHGLDAMRYGVHRVTWAREVHVVRPR